MRSPGDAHIGKGERMLIHPERWSGLRNRYEQERPRRMLALDGGGIRGLLTLGILEKLEALVGSPLCEYFDYIAGTSTGAIIAAGFADRKSTRLNSSHVAI